MRTLFCRTFAIPCPYYVTKMSYLQPKFKKALNVSLILANANNKKRLVGDYFKASSSSYCYAQEASG